MAEYISREAVLKCIDKDGYDNGYDLGYVPHNEAFKELIKTLPAANVQPVVYCKDCKHSDTFSSDCTEATFPLKCLSVRYGGVFPHWFCEHGERNGGADDA